MICVEKKDWENYCSFNREVVFYCLIIFDVGVNDLNFDNIIFKLIIYIV